MMSVYYQRKRTQDAMKRQQQADEKVHELEEEVERMREALLEVMDYIEGRQDGPMSSEIDPNAIWNIANRALDGGGDTDA